VLLDRLVLRILLVESSPQEGSVCDAVFLVSPTGLVQASSRKRELRGDYGLVSHSALLGCSRASVAYVTVVNKVVVRCAMYICMYACTYTYITSFPLTSPTRQVSHRLLNRGQRSRKLPKTPWDTNNPSSSREPLGGIISSRWVCLRQPGYVDGLEPLGKDAAD